MNCCQQCVGIEKIFNDKSARRELKRYQKKGPDKTTQLLIDFIVGQGVAEATLLDIGGGVGAIQLELLKSGVSQVVNVDASSAYLKTAQQEAHCPTRCVGG